MNPYGQCSRLRPLSGSARHVIDMECDVVLHGQSDEGGAQWHDAARGEPNQQGEADGRLKRGDTHRLDCAPCLLDLFTDSINNPRPVSGDGSNDYAGTVGGVVSG